MGTRRSLKAITALNPKPPPPALEAELSKVDFGGKSDESFTCRDLES